MVSLICRLKGSAAVAGILRSPFLPRCLCGRARMNNSSSFDSPSILSAPVLMLPPPAFKAGDENNFRFYHLAEKRIQDLRVELPNDENDAVLVGWSHGWLAFFNQSNNNLFLSDPFSGRYLYFPPIDPLPNPVSKVILSCSPDDEEDECQAVVSFGPEDRLALCWPGRSPAHWTPIGRHLFYEKKPWEYDGSPYPAYGRAYENFKYRSRRKLRSCISQFAIDLQYWFSSLSSKLRYLDRHDDECFSLTICGLMRSHGFDDENCSWLKENKKLLLRAFLQISYLVYDDESDRLFIVERYVNSVDPHNTLGFCVLKVDYQNGRAEKVRLADKDDSSLDGVALFVGMNHSFAVSSAAELGLQPNSIYFTDAVDTRLTHPPDVRRPHHSRGLGIGIFDYQNKTLSPFPYSLHYDHQTFSTPVWFTPSK